MSTIAICCTTLADSAPAAPAAAHGSGIGELLASPFSLILLMVPVMLYVNWQTKRKQDKEKQDLLSRMKRGDRVQTVGGILGTIVEVREKEVVVKVDESNNTKIKLVRSAVATVFSDDEKTDVAK